MNEIKNEDKANQSAILSLLMYFEISREYDDSEYSINQIVADFDKIYGPNAVNGYATYRAMIKAKEAEDVDNVVKDLTEEQIRADYEMRQIEYGKIVNYLKANPEFGDLVMVNQSWSMPDFKDEIGGIGAAAFLDTKNNEVTIAYRGTGAREWLDNGQAMCGINIYPKTKSMYMDHNGSDQQEEAVKYFDMVMEELNDESLQVYVTGHSKGGNKSQYVTINSKYRDRIEACFNFDGQGMAEEMIEYFEETYKDYEASLKKMYGFYSENDFVHGLGISVIPEDQIYYFEASLERNGVQDVILSHYPSDYMDSEGGFTNQTEPGYLAQTIKQLTDETMKLSEYERYMVAVLIMDAMMKGEEINGKGSPETIYKILGGYITIPIVKKILLRSPEGRALLVEVAGDVGVSSINRRIDRKQATIKQLEMIFTFMNTETDKLRKKGVESLIEIEKILNDYCDRKIIGSIDCSDTIKL